MQPLYYLARDTTDTPAPGSDVKNAKAIITFIFFILANGVVIRNPSIRRSSRNNKPRKPIAIPPYVLPVALVLCLLAGQVFDGSTLRDGIVGKDGIQPLDIMALFLSLAYMSISLDHTGFFRWLAWFVAKHGGRSGRKIYSYLFLFFLAISVVFGNDPVILSGTPFLAEFTTKAGLDPIPWIFAQFTAANMASVVLVSSNPTNLVVAGAFSITFISYAAHVLIPFIAAALCVYLSFLAMFLPAHTPWKFWDRLRGGYRAIPSTTSTAPGYVSGTVPNNSTVMHTGTAPNNSTVMHTGTAPNNSTVMYTGTAPNNSTLMHTGPRGYSSPIPKTLSHDTTGDPPALDKWGATVNGALFGICLILLVVLTSVHVDVQVWEITVPFAVVTLIRDAIWGRIIEDNSPASSTQQPAIELSPTFNRRSFVHLQSSAAPPSTASVSVHTAASSVRHTSPSRAHTSGLDVPTSSASEPRNRFERAIDRALTWFEVVLAGCREWIFDLLAQRAPSVLRVGQWLGVARQWLNDRMFWRVVKSLPIGLLPFAFAMFTLVQGLATLGWVEWFARGWTRWVHLTGYKGAIGGMGFVACVLCNCFGTNIGATIFLARVLQVWAATLPSGADADADAARTRIGAIYALAIASNFGAFTLAFPASLAGLLWRNLLAAKNIYVSAAPQFIGLNLPVSFVAMLVASLVLVAQVAIYPH